MYIEKSQNILNKSISHLIMDKQEIITKLEHSVDHSNDKVREMRMHYLIARLYVSLKDDRAIPHFYESQGILEYLGEEGLIGFRNFYRYRGKLEILEFQVESMVVE